MFKFLEKYIMGPMTKLSQLRFVRAIQAAGTASIPFTIVGSMFLVLTILPQALPFLEGIWAATFLKVSSIYMLANKASMGIIALYFLLAISYEYTKIIRDEEGIESLNPMSAVLLSLFGFIMFVPQFTKGSFELLHNPEQGIINGWAIGGDGVSRFAAIGIFTAILTAALTVKIYQFCIQKNIVITMPDAVPSGVANSFTALIPAFILALVVFIIQGILVSLGTDLFSMVAIPFGFVSKIAGSFVGTVVVAIFLTHALWVVGIHGATIINAFLTPVGLENLQKNIDGGSEVFAGQFMNAFAYIGGSGATLGLVLMCIFLAKSEQLKAIGKASLAPGIFQINEPVIFGMPVVYNPDLAIPFIFAPMLGAAVGYLGIASGIFPKIIANTPWPTPVGLSGFIATGSFMGGLLSIIVFFVNSIVWYPFFKRYDKKLVAQEAEILKEHAAE
ncbi:PTS cellobiose transporter subunit IIC [Helcococcus massiliensis]|uniref:PTS cellobiose transporter subunit IIC n=1 Tax=Helcococcus massiliensis TaxID=2040290 RepID=UPI000CDE8D34|nr:PTS cellobiose transporter subunit IIC [Helcococcus massiliensis]